MRPARTRSVVCRGPALGRARDGNAADVSRVDGRTVSRFRRYTTDGYLPGVRLYAVVRVVFFAHAIDCERNDLPGLRR
jgi:hypothetical protein